LLAALLEMLGLPEATAELETQLASHRCLTALVAVAEAQDLEQLAAMVALVLDTAQEAEAEAQLTAQVWQALEALERKES
jgi:hypothetical protein